MKLRAPTTNDVVWITLCVLAFMTIRMILAPDAFVDCPQGTGCDAASLPLISDLP